MTWLTCSYEFHEIRQELDKFPDVLQAKSQTGKHCGRTLLHCAAAYGKREMIRLFVEKGANVNEQDEEGASPLCAAVVQGEADAADELILLGATVDLLTNKGNTALCYAVQMGETELVRVLLKHGANVNIRNARGRTPLMKAFLDYRRPELVRLLVQAGADVNARNNSEKPPLILACESKPPLPLQAIKELFESPIAQVDINYENGKYWPWSHTALVMAIKAEQFSYSGPVVTQWLLLRGAVLSAYYSEHRLQTLPEKMRFVVTPHARWGRRRCMMLFLYQSGLWRLKHDHETAGTLPDTDVVGASYAVRCVLCDPYLCRFLITFL